MADSTDDLKQVYVDIEAQISELEAQVRAAMAQAVSECATRPKSIPEPPLISLNIGNWLNKSHVMERIQKYPLNQVLSLASRVATGPRPPAPPT
jgi:hypothetical protein